MSWRDFSRHIRHLLPADQKKVEEAFQLGERSHEGQMRESGEPFFSHPVAVAESLALLNADAETLIAALLHDAVEDTPLTLEKVRELFGENVATLILGLTKLQEEEFANQPSLDEKIESLRRMFSVMERDVRVMTIKLADRLHNMQTIGFRTLDKQRSVAKETLDIYVKIADRLCMRDLRDELAMLCHAVLEPELHDALLALRERNRKRFALLALTLQDSLQVRTPGLRTEVLSEPKSWEGLHVQYELEKESMRPNVLLNAVFLCESVDACYRLLGAIHQTWPRIVLTFDDFINVPAVNGYRGLQTTVVLEDGTHLRCKIRTHGMHVYARRGIATICFDSHERGILEYLPWTRHIGPLAKESIERSASFWDTLQSDILSEAFIIYGNAHRTVLVPVNATALDGALYLYPETALRLTGIFVNGKKVPLSHTLARADVLEITTDMEKQVNREWLRWSKTGIGSVMIRTALSDETMPVKIETGKKILQDQMLAHHHGYLSELNTAYLKSRLEQQGLGSDTNKIYMQIAEGRLLPQDVERVLYPPPAAKEKQTSVWILRCKALTQDWPVIAQIVLSHEILRIRVRRFGASQLSSIKVTCRMTAIEAQEMERAMQKVEHSTVSLVRRKESILRPVAWTLMFLLWGADPVLVHLLLQQPDITPVNLTVIRFLSYSIIMGMLLLWMMRYRPIRQVRLSFQSRYLWLTALFLFLVSVASYVALQQDSPLHYTIPMTIAGLFLATVLHKKNIVIQTTVWGLVITALWTLFVRTPEWSVTSMAATAIAVLSFTLFSIVSERYKRSQEVSTRIVQYLFFVSVICTLLSIPLLIFTGITPITPASLLLSVLFTVCISGTPYFLYYYLLSHSEVDIGQHYSFLIIFSTLLFQAWLTFSPSWWTVLAGVLMCAGASIATFANRSHTLTI